MEIVKLHYTKSKPVKSFSDIKAEAKEMEKLVDSEFRYGGYSEAFALSHSEVNANPFDFFVVNQKLITDKIFTDKVIINPKIISKDKSKINMIEACMSVPFRKPKNVKRYLRIKVEYQVVDGKGLLKKKVEEIEGLKAHLFQHQIDHSLGKNIYFKSAKQNI